MINDKIKDTTQVIEEIQNDIYKKIYKIGRAETIYFFTLAIKQIEQSGMTIDEAIQILKTTIEVCSDDKFIQDVLKSFNFKEK